ncbi:MAG TPA: NAD(P)H-dependent oxidoreductase [Steroidobacteraceae bacterium]|nr:NAD(P)H-dependent oxidoreductase [Steroidobacteraceae bacterium]
MGDQVIVALVVGSLRKESFSRKVAQALITLSPPSLSCRILEIGDLPLYNEDLDNGTPPASWSRFRAELHASSAVVFVTPEYNRSIPGCLKNAVDVGSRPSGKSMLDGLPAGVVSVTPYNLGAFGANHALRQTFVFLNMLVMQQPEAYVSKAGELFDDQGELKSKETREFLGKFMAAFSQWVEKAAGKHQPSDFDQFMKRRVEVARAYVNGDAAPLDTIVPRSGAASFFPPNGGSEQGAEAVLARYDKDAKVFGSGGDSSFEMLQSGASGDVAFWTGFQSARVKMQGSSEPVAMKLRITEVFRRLGGNWKLVHRHADPMVEPAKRDS